MTTDREPAPIPWRRAFALLRPLRGGVLAMGGLTVSGVLIGLVPPLVLGALINALVARNATAHAALLAGAIAVAVVLEAGAYVASDGMYARNASRLYRNLRLLMFRGALRQRIAAGAERTAGLPSRLRALNLQGSGGLAKLGSITPVLAAALAGHQPGTLMTTYLLAQRVFWSFDGLIDLRLDAQSVRGAVARCFELIDTPASGAIPVNLVTYRGADMGYGTLDAVALLTTCAASEATQNPCRTSLAVSRVTRAT